MCTHFDQFATTISKRNTNIPLEQLYNNLITGSWISGQLDRPDKVGNFLKIVAEGLGIEIQGPEFVDVTRSPFLRAGSLTSHNPTNLTPLAQALSQPTQLPTQPRPLFKSAQLPSWFTQTPSIPNPVPPRSNSRSTRVPQI